jgi:DNA-binding GntR family transcriptional regulator
MSREDAAIKPETWKGGTRENLATIAHSRILDLILSKRLKARDVLQERPLAEWLDMSRTPVREALNRLEAEGVIQRQGKALILHEITIKEMMEVFAVREQLEVLAARLAAERAAISEIEQLERSVRDLMKQKSPPPNEHWSIDDSLHALVSRASDNQILVRYISDLRLRTRMFDIERLPDRLLPGCREHLAILEALKARDPEAAVSAMQKHIQNSRQAILTKLSEY